MRKALVVGINNYPYLNSLFGCINDAKRVATLLQRDGFGNINFDVKELYAQEGDSYISKRNLKNLIQDLFSDTSEVALFYFAGHGYADEHGGYILTSDSQEGNDGIRLSDIAEIISRSKATNRIVVLDCCQSGAMGVSPFFGDNSWVPNNTTYLLACKEGQYSEENNGNGVFTDLFVDALSGGAANLVGEISPGSIYSYIDKALGLWRQRPVFKTNVERFISIRNVKPPIELEYLRMLTQLFPNVTYEYPLNPSFEPTHKDANEKNNEIFALLQKYNRLNLLVPVGAEHMYFAAIESKACKLTPLGVHYWNLVEKNRI